MKRIEEEGSGKRCDNVYVAELATQGARGLRPVATIANRNQKLMYGKDDGRRRVIEEWSFERMRACYVTNLRRVEQRKKRTETPTDMHA